MKKRMLVFLLAAVMTTSGCVTVMATETGADEVPSYDSSMRTDNGINYTFHYTLNDAVEFYVPYEWDSIDSNWDDWDNMNDWNDWDDWDEDSEEQDTEEDDSLRTAVVLANEDNSEGFEVDIYDGEYSYSSLEEILDGFEGNDEVTMAEIIYINDIRCIYYESTDDANYWQSGIIIRTMDGGYYILYSYCDYELKDDFEETAWNIELSINAVDSEDDTEQ